MKVLIQFNRFLSVLVMMTVCATEGAFVHNNFKKMNPGNNITGTIATRFTTRSKLQCTDRCATDDSCDAYQYGGTGPGNCIFIQKNYTDPHRKVFQPEETISMYEIGIIPVQPGDKTGPKTVLYKSLDDSDGYVLRQGAQQMGSVPLVSGKMNLAWTFNGTKKQWVDLGTHTEACMTPPETCGAAGGAISLWVNVLAGYKFYSCGIISSRTAYTSGFMLMTTPDVIEFSLFLQDGRFIADHSKPFGWVHIVLNYLGPNKGIKIYSDGAEQADTNKQSLSYSAGDGTIIIGRPFPNLDRNYGTFQIDELVFFNQALTPEKILMLGSV